MNKKIFTIIIAALICVLCAVSTAATTGSVLYDGADILTEVEETALLEKLNSVSDAYKVELAIATVDGTGSMSATEYVSYYFDNSGLGIGDSRDAVLFLIDMDAREFRILSNGDVGAAAVSMDDIDNITDMVSSDLSDGEYYSAFVTFIDECEYQIDGQINGFPFKTGKSLAIALGVGFVVAFIATGSMKSQLKTVRASKEADSYVRQGSLSINDSRDVFLYSHITKTKRESKSSGSGSSGGSSRNVGGGSF
jgi:uncharacterized protein